jgi:hypothetical protein
MQLNVVVEGANIFIGAGCLHSCRSFHGFFGKERPYYVSILI